jgi:glutamine amidotransferase-like uncharacterized protein
MKLWIIFCPLAVVLSSCNLQSANPSPDGAGPSQGLVSTPTDNPFNTTVPGKGKKLALVYDGAGACPEGCAQAAVDSAVQAGFTTKIVGPNDLSASSTQQDIDQLFQGAAIWIQPGGHSDEAYQAMSPTLRDSIINFIKNGGGYVGFCAGAFITTKEIGTTGLPGLGIFPGSTAPLTAGGIMMETVKWAGNTRTIYFEGGPYMYNLDPSVETVAVYSDGVTVAAARTTYGSGRVFISGPHPEAPAWWSNGVVIDPDGSDRDLAGDMMKWSAKLE